MKISSLILIIILSCVSTSAIAMQATFNTEPARLTKSRSVTQYAYNIQEVDGVWIYDYVEIEGKVTKAKIKEAMRLEKNADQPFDPADVEIEQSIAEERLAEIAQMSYAQIDTHVDSTFSDLSVAQRSSLKKLYRGVLALIKQLDLE